MFVDLVVDGIPVTVTDTVEGSAFGLDDAAKAAASSSSGGGGTRARYSIQVFDEEDMTAAGGADADAAIEAAVAEAVAAAAAEAEAEAEAAGADVGQQAEGQREAIGSS